MTKSGRSRMKYVWAVAGCLVLSVCASAVLAKEKRMPEDTVTGSSEAIATVDGMPIAMPEFEKAARRNMSGVLSYFHEKYGAAQTSGFWKSSFGGEVPLAVLKQKALDDAVRTKIRQRIAADEGVLGDISYSGFLRGLEQENARRAKAAANHEVIYGPIQYNEDTYFEYVMTNATTAVKRGMLADLRSHAEEQTLKAFYEQHKRELYQTPGSARVLSLSASFLNADQEVDPAQKKKAAARLREAEAKLKQGATFEEIARIYADRGAAQELSFNLANDRQNARSPVAQTAARMKAGETSGIVEENGSLYLLKCTEKVEPGSAFSKYEDMKDQVEQDTIDWQYEERIRQKLAAAEIKVDESLYEAWNVQN
ncbi:peptidyl-prolyl cis-trans isomerase [Paenibacillus chibensis]|uniref:peptidylprolyl isomerase n=1 Tax=Paenibacillus chibensis TaxID=59846 RepID=UPI000FDA64EB|nr:peptidylprolyl isomerase [Paenibacillus chibensis]MEC0370103.1 peptidylprolyl isomerase [Paenibacillus chibensis]